MSAMASSLASIVLANSTLILASSHTDFPSCSSISLYFEMSIDFDFGL